jgi:hypothetical protein
MLKLKPLFRKWINSLGTISKPTANKDDKKEEETTQELQTECNIKPYCYVVKNKGYSGICIN